MVCHSDGDVEKLKVVIVDSDNIGRLMINCRWSNGIHECIEVKNHLQP